MRKFQQLSNVVTVGLATLTQAGVALAQVQPPKIGQVPPGTSLTNILIVVGNWMLTIAGALAVVYLIYGGIMYITGGEKGAEKAKQMIINAITGLVIIALASLIATLVKKTLGA